jgi:hypothetical protein
MNLPNVGLIGRGIGERLIAQRRFANVIIPAWSLEVSDASNCLMVVLSSSESVFHIVKHLLAHDSARDAARSL